MLNFKKHILSSTHKHRINSLFLTCTILLLSTFTAAEERFAGIGIQSLDYDLDELPSISITSIGFKGGYIFSPYLSFEGQVFYGLKSDHIEKNDTEIEIDLSITMAAYAKGTYPINDWYNIYGLAGFSYALINAETKQPYDSIKQKEVSLSIGGGMSVEISKSLHIQLEYINYSTTNKSTIYGLNLNLVKNF